MADTTQYSETVEGEAAQDDWPLHTVEECWAACQCFRLLCKNNISLNISLPPLCPRDTSPPVTQTKDRASFLVCDLYLSWDIGVGALKATCGPDNT